MLASQVRHVSGVVSFVSRCAAVVWSFGGRCSRFGLRLLVEPTPGRVLLAALLCGCIGSATAASTTWTNLAGTNLWSDAGNWSAGKPTSSLVAVFDAVTANCSVDEDATCLGMDIRSNYNGGGASTITQASGKTMTVGSSGWVQAGGTFTGGNSTIAVQGPLTLTSPASFTSTSGTLSIGGNVTTPIGTFIANGGSVYLDSRGSVTITSGCSFNHLTSNPGLYDGLVGYWKLDETSTSGSAADSSGNGNNGTYTGPPLVTGTVATAIAFANPKAIEFSTGGSANYITIPNDPSVLQHVNESSYSLSAWVYAKTLPTWTGSRESSVYGIITKANGTSRPTGLGFQMYAANLPLGIFNYTTSAGSNSPQQEPSAGISAGVWNHLVGVWNNAIATGFLYVNGGYVPGGPLAAGTTLKDLGTAPWRIGCGASGDATYDWQANAYIDDVRIYNRALSYDEAVALYNGGAPPVAWTTSLGAPLTVNGNLTLINGVFDAVSYDLTVGGSWLNNGATFTPRGRSVTLSGGATGKFIKTNGQPFSTLTVAGSGGGWTQQDQIDVQGTLSISNGTLDTSSSNHPIRARTCYQTAGIFTANSGIVDLSAPTDQSLIMISPFNDLRLENASDTGLVAYWKLDEGNSTVEDWSGNLGSKGLGVVSNGSWSTGATLSGGGAFQFENNASLIFNGTTTKVDTPAAPFPSVSNTFTMCFWAYPDQTRTAKTESTSTGALTAGNRYAIFPDYSTGEFAVASQSGAGVTVGTNGVTVGEAYTGWNGTDAASSGALLNYDTTISGWTHVAVAFSSGVPTLYLNGVAVRTGLTAAKTIHPGHCLGYSSRYGKPNFADIGHYSGKLDDVRIYNYALGTTELARLIAGQERASGTAVTTTYTLTRALAVTGTLDIAHGNLTTAGFDITCGGTWENDVGSGGFTTAAGTVTLNGANQTIIGMNTFFNLTKSTASACTLTFPVGGATQTVLGLLTLNGASGNLLTLASATPGTQWRVDPRARRACTYLSVSDGLNLRRPPINPSNSINGGNDTNWFGPPAANVAVGYPPIQ